MGAKVRRRGAARKLAGDAPAVSDHLRLREGTDAVSAPPRSARDGRIDAVAALIRPWLRTAQIERHLAVVDALLVARLAAEPLLAGAGCTTLDLLVLAGAARACVCGGQHRHERHRHDAYPSLHDRWRHRFLPVAAWLVGAGDEQEISNVGYRALRFLPRNCRRVPQSAG